MLIKSRYRVVLALLLCLLLSLTSLTYASPMPGDITDHWAKSELTSWVDLGYGSGYTDGTFRPDNFITRAEFVSFVNNAFGFTESKPFTFPDVPTEAWYMTQIARAQGADYIAGYEDGTFRPDGFITRQEVACILARILMLDTTGTTSSLDKFTDKEQIPSWSLSSINAVAAKALMGGYPDGTFKPTRNISRAEVVVILTRAKKIAVLRSISATNGSVTMTVRGNRQGLTKDDFIISAKLDGIDYSLGNLQLDPVQLSYSFTAVSKSSKEQKLLLTINANPNSMRAAGGSGATVLIPVETSSSDGGGGGGGGGGGTVTPPPPPPPNNPPSTPVITKVPTGNVSDSADVTITASSTDPDGDTITYEWTGRIAETSKYPQGRHVITCKAIDEHGAESSQSAVVFFSLDASGSGGMMLTDPESRIYENGIDGASIISYTFNVPSVSGHYGNDYAWINGLNFQTHQWEQVRYDTTSNGIYFEGDLTPGTYSRLEFFYYASHCMYNKSNITYTVEFAFDRTTDPENPPGISNVNITGSAVVGGTLTGNYTFTDSNGDLEGVSTYQWYQADDAVGTNKTAIAGATSSTYIVDTADDGKFITFEVTPVALTGDTGTLTGSPAVSAPLEIAEKAPVATDVQISGIPNEGTTLTGSYTYFDENGDAEGTSTFAWYLADDSAGTGLTAIAGATADTYTLTASDVGKYISFEVTPVAATGTTPGAPVSSAFSGPVITNSAPTAGAVNISGTLTEGQILTGTYTFTDADGDAEGTSTFAWYLADDSAGTGMTAIAGATAATYTLAASDVGKYISFEVTPVAASGATPGSPVSSVFSGPVAAATL